MTGEQQRCITPVSFTLDSVSLSEQQGSRGEVEVKEQEEEEEKEEEKRMEEDIPLLALAPDASLPEEQPSVSADVPDSPAFHFLDEHLVPP
ncbi:unnamed protein product [Pleuronectes platessa]|uniref:Uncharacterized protein n=1 Tax=Pleuronectes platessa TaxID=8262 RepID=A0A9N7US73_PLEPL|nr:unnamed protein product [Pleuronectes platessa]